MDINAILSELTLEEKVSLCSGKDFWHTTDVERLGVPAVMMCDGPHGLRKQEGSADHMGLNPSIETVCYRLITEEQLTEMLKALNAR